MTGREFEETLEARRLERLERSRLRALAAQRSAAVAVRLAEPEAARPIDVPTV